MLIANIRLFVHEEECARTRLVLVSASTPSVSAYLKASVKSSSIPLYIEPLNRLPLFTIIS